MTKSKIILSILLFSCLSFIIGYFASTNNFLSKINVNTKDISLFKSPTPDRTLDIYTIDNLSQIKYGKNEIFIESVLEEKDKYTSYLFSHTFLPNPSNNLNKKVSGVINIPKSDNSNTKFPLILMIRGYVDQELYTSGMGTKRGAEYFADNGFITLAPDFLGYGKSDIESGNIFESRFQTYTTILSIFDNLDSLDKWDKTNIFIWAHSNGGQIALTFQTIKKTQIPTVLWAPVTMPFPYSILYYTNESDDKGKFIRSKLAEFEDLYNVDLYSFENYKDRIIAPIYLFQGGVDDAIPVDQTVNFVKALKQTNENVSYHFYPGSDHNMQPDWGNAIEKSLLFYKKYLK